MAKKRGEETGRVAGDRFKAGGRAPEPVRYILFGQGGVGKTSLILRGDPLPAAAPGGSYVLIDPNHPGEGEPSEAAWEPKDIAAARLAAAHLIVEPGIRRIVRLVSEDARDDEPIKLLEVNENTIAAGVVPVHFGPDPARGIPYPSTIVEITPDEFGQLEAGALRLPDGWRIGASYTRAAAPR